MTLLDLIYNQNLNIQNTNKKDCIFMLSMNDKLQNHIHSFHAAAIFSLAEATSAQFLINNFKDFENSVVPLLRATNTKYKKPCITDIYAKAFLVNQSIEEIINILNEKKRALVTIKVEIIDEFDSIIFIGTFEWFLSMNS
jgi:hypothetical protein